MNKKINEKIRRFLTLLSVIACILCGFFLLSANFLTENISHYPQILSFSQARYVNTIKTKKVKEILMWTSYFGRVFLWKNVFQRLNDKECEVNECVIHTDKTKFENADAVLFHSSDMQALSLKTVHVLNVKRRNSQRFIYFNMESPRESSREYLKKFPNFFNWTMTFRRDSDVPVPYGNIIGNSGKEETEAKIPFVSQDDLNKRKMSVWIVSHCKTFSKREKLIENLEKFISIDVIGKCRERKCGQRSVIGAAKRDPEEDECFKDISQYAFYLAFENSLCTDYVTEKLYRTLKLGVVPVVYGGSNYSLLAPPQSVIDSRNFGTVKELADYLLRVKNNATLYNSYLRWKLSYDIELGSPYKPLICDLCKKLHSSQNMNARKSYKNIANWFLEENMQCLHYEDFFPRN